MNGSKFFLFSKTILGGLVLLGEVAKLYWGVQLFDEAEVEDAFDALVTLLAFIALVIGRAKATKSLTLNPLSKSSE